MYIYICIYIYIYVHIYMSMYIFIHEFLYMSIHKYVCMYLCICVYIYIRLYILSYRHAVLGPFAVPCAGAGANGREDGGGFVEVCDSVELPSVLSHLSASQHRYKFSKVSWLLDLLYSNTYIADF